MRGCSFYSNHKLHPSGGFCRSRSVHVTAQYLSDENSLHKFQLPYRLRRRRWKVGERASDGGGSPINHPLTNCRTGCFARKRPLREPCRVLAGRSPPQAGLLPPSSGGLRKKDPARHAQAAEARKPRKWGITVFIRGSLVGES
ncbi:unnamed protein product [Lasius platythorax]|uniref:Uncharacterized protein n=1 Tax=Lasius platythorax TaxID=488582 RepID=A0AAV2NZW4_9HYME